MMDQVSRRQFSWERVLINSHGLSKPLSSVLVAIDKDDVSSVDVNLVTNDQILRLIELLLL